MQRANWGFAGLVGACLMLVSPALCRAQQSDDADCHGQTVSALAQQYGGLDAAATALGFPSVQALQEAIREACVAIDFSAGFANSADLSLNDGASINGTTLVLTDGGFQEARSAFYRVPVNIQSFANDFTFLLTTPGTNPLADGITFTIYSGASPTAVGGAGGSLGYGLVFQGEPLIPNSVAVKFDLFNNAGEGNNSTGLYQDGQLPFVPAITLDPNVINLHSAHVFHVHVTYNGVNLTVTITDTVTNASSKQVYAVNIPLIVGSNTAFVGFTAGTGGLTATQEILTWLFVPGP